MRASLRWILCCPHCHHDLTLYSKETQEIPSSGCPAVVLKGQSCATCADHTINVLQGTFACTSCGKKYPIVDGIPLFGAISEYSLRSSETKVTPKVRKAIESMMPSSHYYSQEFIFGLGAYLYDTFVHKGEVYHYLRKWNGELNPKWLKGCLDSQIARDVMYQRYDKLFPYEEHAVAFDIACGNAIGAVSLARKGFTSVALDADLRSLTLAQRRASEDKVHVDLVQGDVENLPFKDGSMHQGMSVETVEHVKHQEACLLEMWRLLKPNGRFYVNTPNQYFLWDAHDSRIPFLHWFPYRIKNKIAITLRRGNLIYNQDKKDVEWGLNRYLSLKRLLAVLGNPPLVDEFFPESSPVWWKQATIHLVKTLSFLTRQPKTVFLGCIGVVVRKPQMRQ